MMRYLNNHRDDNESGLVLIWRQCGAFWLPMPPGVGFDGLLAHQGLLIPVENKNGNLAPSRRKLTKREQTVKTELAYRGVEVRIVENEDQALRLVRAK